VTEKRARLVASIDNMRNANKILVGKPEWKGPPLGKQEVLGNANRLLSFDTTRTA
jgi:hypothetical protein